MEILLWLGVLLVSLFTLIKSADFFTNYSSKIGLLLGLSSFIVGATIIAVGTSLPELVSSFFAIESGAGEFVVDNIIGSNVANALLILGIAAIVARTLVIKTSLVDVDLPFFFMSLALFVYFIWDKVITMPEGIALVVFFLVFIIYNLKQGGHEDDTDELESLKKQYSGNNQKHWKWLLMLKYGGIVLISLVFLVFSAKYLVDSILTLSTLFGISSSLLTITVVAIGTSLPEILTSIAAVRMGNHAMAIGNVLGSNTFNLLLIGGFPALFANLPVNDQTFTIGMPFLIIATLVTIFVTLDNKVRAWEGIAMLAFYGIFIGKIVGIL